MNPIANGGKSYLNCMVVGRGKKLTAARKSEFPCFDGARGPKKKIKKICDLPVAKSYFQTMEQRPGRRFARSAAVDRCIILCKMHINDCEIFKYIYLNF